MPVCSSDGKRRRGDRRGRRGDRRARRRCRGRRSRRMRVAPGGAADRARHRQLVVRRRSGRGDHLAPASMGEIAIGEAEARDRAAETFLAGLVEIEARVEERALHVRADRLAFREQRAGRQAHEAHRTRALHAQHAGDRAVAEDAAGANRALEAGEGELLAGDEPARGFGAHRLGQRGHGEHDSRQRDSDTHQHAGLTPC